MMTIKLLSQPPSVPAAEDHTVYAQAPLAGEVFTKKTAENEQYFPTGRAEHVQASAISRTEFLKPGPNPFKILILIGVGFLVFKYLKGAK